MTRNVEQVDLLEWLQKATAARRTSALLVVAAPQPRRSRARARGHAAPPTADLELTTRQAPAMVDQREAPPESVVPQSYPPSEPAAARRLRADEADDVSSAPSISPVVAPPPVKVTPRRRQVAGRARRPLVLAGCALGLALATVGWMGTRDVDAGSETMPVSPVSEPECAAGDGSTDSAESAILGFEHGYYVTRNAEAARAFVAPSGRVAGPVEIQRGIDAVPEGTTWCVVASATSDPAVYAVDVREQRPGETRIYEQIVTTTVVDGKTLIEDIRHRGEHS